MFTDAHCHPFDLVKVFSGAEAQCASLGVMRAASASDTESFEYIEAIAQSARNTGAPELLRCFAVHPQMPLALTNGERMPPLKDGIALLEHLAAAGRLAAIGETGFDLFNAAFRETEKTQDELFAVHLEAALRYNLPMVLHVRRAMHKIFARAAELKKCPAVIFHSWPGTAGEGEALLKRGINAFFSFGAAVMLNHREAMRCAARFPASRILTETDAPYQPPRGTPFSSYDCLPGIVKTIALLREQSGSDGDAKALETIIQNNFCAAFNQSVTTASLCC